MSKHSQNYPEQWQMKPLIEVVSLNPNYSSPEQEDYAFIPMDALNTETMEISYYKRRNQDKLTNVKIKNDDVLFARITPSTENGKGALIHNLQEPIAYGSTELVVLSPIKEYILPKFLFYITKLPRFRNRAVSLMEGATGRQRVPKFFFESQKILLPPLREQKRMVSILSNIDNSINNSHKLIDYLQLLKKGLMQRLFTEGIGHTEFKETRLWKIPEEWDIVKLEDVAEINPSYEVPNQDDYLFLEMSSIDEESFNPNYWLRRSKDRLTNTIFKNGDVLFAKITPCVENGKGALIQKLNEPVASGSTELVVLSPNEKINSFFLYYLTKTEKFRNKAISLMEGATGRQRVPNFFFKSYKVMLPSLKEQKEISIVLQNFDYRMIKEKELVLMFKKIKMGLMQELLTGKKRVNLN